MRAELGIGPDEVVVGTIANFRRPEGLPEPARDRRALLVDRGWPGRIVAVGQGPLEAEMRALHDRLGLGDRVLLLGQRDDAVRVLAACDVFTMASDNEGLPVALMEALALGLPVAATAVGGIPEAVTDGVEGLLVPPSQPEALAGRHRGDHRTTTTGARAWPPRRRSPASASTSASPPPASSRSTGSVRPGEPPERIRARGPHLGDLGAATARRRTATRSSRCSRARSGARHDPRYDTLFAWKHEENAFGPSPAWVAVDGDRIAGFRVLMRWEFVDAAGSVRAVRAVDTATHPDYQGQGIFTRLALHALDELRADGVDFVFNTPNDQSRPGYLKMGWQVVGRLPTAVRPDRARAASRASRPPGCRPSGGRRRAPRATPRSTSSPTTPRSPRLLASLPDARRAAHAADAPSTCAGGTARRCSATARSSAPGGVAGRHRDLPDPPPGPAAGGRALRRDRRAAATGGSRRRSPGAVTRAADADYVIRLGGGLVAPGGLVRLPGQGPLLTWRALAVAGAARTPGT